MDRKRGSVGPSARLVRGLFLLLSLYLTLSGALHAQSASVVSELSASTITRDESVILNVTAIGVDGELDASALDKDFDVLSQSSSQQISTISNGSNRPVTTRVLKWTLEMLPREVGVFTVPAVTVGGMSSQLLTLTVNEIPAGARRDVFVEASVDSRTPWVQAQVLMTVRVFQAIEIVDGGLSDPAGTDIQVQRIGKDTYSSETRDGREFRVTERRFALFPQKSGLLTIEPIVLSVSVPASTTTARGFFSPTRKLTRRSDAMTLDVRPRTSTGATWWLPASAVQLEASWTDDVSQAVVDQPLTRTIVLRAGGVLDSQLPDLGIPAIDGVSLYAEEPVRVLGMNERGLVAEQTIKWALIPQREGELVLPAISVDWFDTVTGRSETAELPEERILVGRSAAAASSQAASPASNSGGNTGGEVGSNAVVESAADVAGVAVGADDVGNAGLAENLTDTDQVSPVAAGGVADQADGPADNQAAARETLEPLASLDSTASGGSEAGNSPSAAQTGGAGSAITASEAASEKGISAPGAGQTVDGSVVLPGSAPVGTERLFDKPWRLATMLLLALWLGSLMAFWWWRRRVGRAQAGASSETAGAGRARRHLYKLVPLAEVEACSKSDDPAALSSALLRWAAQQWPEQPPRTLPELAFRVGQGSACEALKSLDAALYSRHTTQADRQELMSGMRSLPGDLSAAVANGGNNAAVDPVADTAVGARSDGSLPAL